MMKVLNLDAGIGGNRKLWKDVEVTAVEIDPIIAGIYRDQHENDNIIIGDAHKYLLENFRLFDVIWSSPPCQKNSKMALYGRNRTPAYPDLTLYERVIFLETYFKGKWVVENVDPYYTPLIPPTKKLGRHLFWANFPIGNFEIPNIKNFINISSDTQKLKDWLGIQYEGNVYYQGNHDPSQVLRNCVHPETGLYILDCAREIIRKENVEQLELFEQ